MKESVKLIKNQIRAYNTWLDEFENHTKYNEIKSKRDALESDIELLSNHSVLHSIIERSLPTLSEINEGAKKFERYKDTMSEVEGAESSGRYWGFKEGVDWMKKRMTSL